MAMGRNPKVDAARFSMVPRNDVPRSTFSNRFMHKTTFEEGLLIPIYVDEVLPGDAFKVKMTALTRLASPIVPIMDNLAFESAFFFVPNRILWSHWEQFMGEKLTVAETTEYLIPAVTVAALGMLPGTLNDYFGIYNNNSGNAIGVCAFPYRAYNMIWNDWFRESALQDKLVEIVGDGPDPSAGYSLRNVCVKPDYFTTAKPWPQATTNATTTGDLTLPLVPGGGMINPMAGVPVSGLGVAAANVPTAGPATISVTGGRTEVFPNYFQTSVDDVFIKAPVAGATLLDVRVLINDIRTANTVQLMMERDARGGTRYVEKIMSHFGVRPPDARVQRPEYLGGGRTMVTVNPVAQTSATAVAGANFQYAQKLGQLAAVGYAAAHGHGFSHSFTEHGYIMGLVWCRSDLTYQQGIERHWLRKSQFDFYFPAMAHLGEQAIQLREIYATGAAADLNVFGYQQRWEEYRWKGSRTSGYFRSGFATPLDQWHFGINFGAPPALNSAFVTESAPMARVLQVTAPFSAQLMTDVMIERTVTRAIPVFSVPGMGPRL